MSMVDELAKDTVAVVLAGGKGTRLGALTRKICKPALPFGAGCRNIDFALANCVNSGIRRIGVVTQHEAEVLHDHLDTVWHHHQVEGPGHFIEAWPAELRAPIWGYRGTADAVFHNLEAIQRFGCRRVLVLAGDHVYKMDYRTILEHHHRRRADATVGCVEVPVEDTHQFGVLSVTDAGRIERFVEKPKTPDEFPSAGPYVLASMGIYVFDTAFLAHLLRRDALRNDSRHDFGNDILPSILQTARVFAYPFRDAPDCEVPYWRDVGTPGAYWRAHMDLLGESPRFCLDSPVWPVARVDQRPLRTVRYADSSGCGAASLIAPGCDINGRVRSSVLFSGVTVGAGADVDASVILPGAVVGRGCRVRGVVLDSGCRVPDGMIADAWSRDVAAVVEPIVLTADDFAETSVVYRDDRLLAEGGC